MANLLSQIEIKGISIRNRIVMPPIASETSEEGRVSPKTIDYYVKRARGGIGLIIVEHSFIEPRGRYSEKQLTIKDDKSLEGLSKLVEELHKTGAKIGIQITHAGGAAKSKIIGEQPVAPSAVKVPKGEEVARELTKEDMEFIKEAFVSAAARAKKAGFDLVEIHGAHGYLLNQFYSPLTNRRTDEYGGSRENRLKFPLEVVSAVREEVGSDFCVAYRLGADDRMEGGLTLDDGVFAAQQLEKAGIDILDISGGHGGYGATTEMSQGYLVYMVEAIKPVIKIPTIITGGIKEPEFADELIRQGKTDMVGIGRALLADVDWAKKAIETLG